MLFLYSGTPGSYKSYHAVCDILNDLKHGYNVIANFPVNYQKLGINPRGRFIFIKNSDVTVEYFLNFARENHKKGYKAQTMVYLDEASTMFNARLFNDKGRIEWINFFANHRHFNYNFTLITQMDIMLDKQIRGLIETEVRHRALRNYKLFGFLLNLLFHGCYIAVQMWYPCKLKVGSDFKLFSKKKAQCYDTMALFIDDKSDKQQVIEKVDKSQNKEVKNNATSEHEQIEGSGRIRFKKSVDVHSSSDVDGSIDVVDSDNAFNG